jgi:hypothetical protein
MSVGKIEKLHPAEFGVIKEALFRVWNESGRGVDSEAYYTAHLELSFTRFIWDSFWKTGLKIGDGKGMSGDVALPSIHDDHLDTAFRKIWGEYLKTYAT